MLTPTRLGGLMGDVEDQYREDEQRREAESITDCNARINRLRELIPQVVVLVNEKPTPGGNWLTIDGEQLIGWTITYWYNHVSSIDHYLLSDGRVAVYVNEPSGFKLKTVELHDIQTDDEVNDMNFVTGIIQWCESLIAEHAPRPVKKRTFHEMLFGRRNN